MSAPRLMQMYYRTPNSCEKGAKIDYDHENDRFSVALQSGKLLDFVPDGTGMIRGNSKQD